MPSLATLNLIPPTDDKEFELMTKDYCEFKFGPSELFGRKGQGQSGIDIISQSKTGIVGIQCKNYNKTLINCKSIDQMIQLAESFQMPMSVFMIATTAERDARIQEYVYKINEERNKESKFGVMIVYWDQIGDYIKSNKVLLNKYYNGITNIQENKEGENLPIINVKDLKDEFSKCISKFQVYDFMNVDPIIGMPGNMPIEIECFILEATNLLNRAFICQSENCYAIISEFVFKIQQYFAYLSTILHPTLNEGYTIQNPYILKDIDIIREGIKEHKICIDLVFSQIFKGVSFYV